MSDDRTKIEKLANPTPEELADRLEAWLSNSGYRPGDVTTSSMRASIGALVCSHMPMVLAALRAAHIDLGRSALAEDGRGE